MKILLLLYSVETKKVLSDDPGLEDSVCPFPNGQVRFSLENFKGKTNFRLNYFER